MYSRIFSDKSLNSRDFLFKCIDCDSILEVNLEEDDEINRVHDRKMYIECPCGGICKALFD
jgi:hypothetical protein